MKPSVLVGINDLRMPYSPRKRCRFKIDFWGHVRYHFLFMITRLLCRPTAWLGYGLLLLSSMGASGALIHRYPFNETGGTAVQDSIGTAHGNLVGGGGFDGQGQLHLD